MKKLYTVLTPKEIISLNGIAGPLTTPVEIDDNAIIKMIRLGYEIYQHNPYLPTEKVKVTTTNFNRIVFPTSKNESIKKAIKIEEDKKLADELKVDVVVNNDQNNHSHNKNNNYKKLNKSDNFVK